MDPGIVAVLVAVLIGLLIGAPALARAAKRRRRALQLCVECGRILILGERTCDCP
jgi:hypothetical protein